ncbi:hypothetical protein Hanom_Chr09g00856871 [Helianthus anomalus]
MPRAIGIVTPSPPPSATLCNSFFSPPPPVRSPIFVASPQLTITRPPYVN